MVEQRRHHGLSAVFGHYLVETRVGRVGHAPAVAEDLDYPVLHRSHQGDELGGDGYVLRRGRAGEEDGVLRWKVVRTLFRVVLDDTADDHRAEPLAHVTFVEVRGGGDLVTGRGRQPRHRVEEAGPVTNARHDRDGPFVQGADHASGEGFGPFLIDFLRVHVTSFP